MNYLVIGVSSYDTLIYLDDFTKKISDDMSLWAKDIFKTIGGTGAGKAMALDALGENTLLVTELGQDKQRNLILDYYKKQTSIKYKVLDADKTTTHTNLMYGEGKRISIFTSASKHVSFDSKIEKDIKNSDVVFLNINDYCRQYIPFIHEYKPLVVVDIHDYNVGNPYHKEFIDVADILFVSGVHIENERGFLMDHIVGKKMVIITKGKKGSICIDENRTIYQQKAYQGFSYVDANGAGDTFSVAFISRYLKTIDIQDALKFASIAGAMACSSPLLYNPKASYKQIDSFMKETF